MLKPHEWSVLHPVVLTAGQKIAQASRTRYKGEKHHFGTSNGV